MKILLYAVLLFCIAGSYAKAANEWTVPGKIIVKLNAASPLYERWQSAGRQGGIPEFTPLIGPHTSRGFISTSTLQALEKYQDSFLAKSNSSRTGRIARILVVEFSAPLDGEALAKKLSAIPGVDYAEPMPKHRLSLVPNDPRINEQHYLSQVNAYAAWDLVPQTGKIPLLAVVDTGVDYLHEDLAANIYINPGEDGSDGSGRSRRSNGVDDDQNGKVDDWHGWDFSSSSTESGEDNDPAPGNLHGTHVAGIAGAVHDNLRGIAGLAPRIRILPVKVGPDAASSESVERGYDGIVYAAAMGADVINCSWGSPSRSEAESEVISYVTGLGSLIIAAAGNDALNAPYFPAAFANVVSVGAVDWSDNKAGFSNYHASVDISAPGVDILSTFPNNSYGQLDGTSMASPLVSGIAAILRSRFPNYNPLQIGEQLKATATSLDAKQPNYAGLIGRGRVNYHEALRQSNAKSAIVYSYTVTDENRDSVLDPGETISINITLQNILAPANAVSVELMPVNAEHTISFIRNSSIVGNISSGDTASIQQPIVFTVPDSVSFNYQQTFAVIITDSEGQMSRESIVLTFRPSFRNFRENNIHVTFNSNGSIGFNDYPSNTQGIGFRYRGGENLLYEGALMIATAQNRISDVARNSSRKNTGFGTMIEPLHYIRPGSFAALEGETSFGDNRAPNQAGVDVAQHIYQFSEAENSNSVIVSYDVKNMSGTRADNLYTGMFFDWDIGNPAFNQAVFDFESGVGYAQNIGDDTAPLTGAVLLGSEKINFYAVDNDGRRDGVEVYNNFSAAEKWGLLSGGVSRRISSIADISFVFGAGPVALNDQEFHRFVFALLAAPSLQELRTAAAHARATARRMGIADGIYTPPPTETGLISVYPLPAEKGPVTVSFSLANRSATRVDIVNVLGQVVVVLSDEEMPRAGSHTLTFNAEDLAIGQYFVRLVGTDFVQAMPFVIVR